MWSGVLKVLFCGLLLLFCVVFVVCVLWGECVVCVLLSMYRGIPFPEILFQGIFLQWIEFMDFKMFLISLLSNFYFKFQ